MYRAKLAESIERHPTQYHNHDAGKIADTAYETLTTKGLRAININAHGWKSAAKAFGIANTYTAWEQWFKGDLTPVPIGDNVTLNTERAAQELIDVCREKSAKPAFDVVIKTNMDPAIVQGFIDDMTKLGGKVTYIKE